jgi:alkanesulfonate monooxygenase SsuD/methylene tetrahydromethanopterin reductase-like flavin-dependent oxidoreductase (luciferase family)
MRIGIVILPQLPWREQASLWRRAEAYGFDHAWTYDHLTWDDLADEAWGATMPTLVAAAGVTERIPLGTWVASPNYRHPVTFARDVFGLDDVAGGGRTLLAVGAGTSRSDGRVLGSGAAGGRELEPRDRAARLEEFVGLLDLLMRQPRTSFEGRFYEAVDAITHIPGRAAPEPPPFVIAANGPRLMRLATRHDGWATTGIDSDDDGAWWGHIAQLSARFEEIAAEAGPLRDGFRRMLSIDAAPTFSLVSAAYFEDVVRRAGELGFTDVVAHWPRPTAPYQAPESVLDEVADLLPALRKQA